MKNTISIIALAILSLSNQAHAVMPSEQTAKYYADMDIPALANQINASIDIDTKYDFYKY